MRLEEIERTRLHMAMELFVLSDTQLNSMDEWQAAIDRERFPLRLNNKTPISALKGFLPASLRGNATGFECGHSPVEVFVRGRPRASFDRAWRYVLTFRWGGDFRELESAWMAATAYAKATGGVIFDDEEGKTHTVAEACEIVQDIERSMPKVEELLRDIKRV
jgi:hypothetical protein